MRADTGVLLVADLLTLPVIRNPDDKNFDLEKYLTTVFAENK